ncbi:ATP-binding protein [Paracoccus sp. 1_MG-2023]|uniref:hybrid sensor histidine kinase/response regulator n=1 Tax=unclassified Paracoccus (in: a-proteobacteria) TaxID=2688777 RepID=UPI001C09D16E|nr:MULTISPECIES: ATP-binding protein [unclassified Paracoccus (in: a-proteobacteria)]MBU2956078.1 PAS domain S-box protein [Paracoccus sp. C2R09]MDO6669484.1 ATP-binding protein [Paracoccus sp. 1_MG-2023]
MTQDSKRQGLLRQQWTGFLWIAALVACLAQTVLLSREVLQGLDRLSTAPLDDVRWTLSQTEVELFRMILAMHDVDEEDLDDPSDLRRRFDVFFGRVNTLATSSRFVRFRAEPKVAASLETVQDFLDSSVPLIDGNDADLIAAVPDLIDRAESLAPEVRQLALAGIPLFAQSADQRRVEIMGTLRQLAATALVLIAGLIISLAVLQRVHRRATRIAFENETVRSRFEAAISSSLDAVFVIDTRGCIIEFNGASETIFGYSRSEVIGKRIVDLTIPHDERQDYIERLEHYRKTGESQLVGKGRQRIRLMHRSGEVFPAEISVSAALSNRQEVFVAFARDIRAELAAEQDLRDARDRARAGEKAKTKLLTVMSHEMRTPLNGILGSLELIRSEELTPRQQRMLAAIGTSGELLLSHVNKVLDLSRLDADRAERREEEFDLQELIEGLMDSLRPAALERGNDLDTAYLGQETGSVRGDKRAIQQCLVNLVGNAIKFTRGGSVSVEVERVDDGAMVEFRVADTGLGIPEEELPHIFDEFMTIDTDYARENPGTGLGLAITRKLVQNMGGTITVDSIEGEGTMFTIRAPLPRVAPVRARAKPAPLPDIEGGLHVLIVEDNAVNRMILEHMLDELGCTHESAENGDTGIALAAGSRFDLLLLDISMPGKDGLETLAGIRALNVQASGARAIAITAHAGQEDRDRILAVFDDMLTKPINLARLAEKISPAEPAPAEEDTAADFIARFGRDAFAGHIRDLQGELAGLVAGLKDAPGLETADRETAHKLAGSAAILGQASLRRTLQRLEHLPAPAWTEEGRELLAELDREGAALSAVQAA